MCSSILPPQKTQKRMSRIAQIIASMTPDQQRVVVSLRNKHSCLMELDRKSVIPRLQGISVWRNYLAGEGRKLDTIPHRYKVPDGKGGYDERETYFTYLLEVH